MIFFLSSRQSWPIEVGWRFFDKIAHGLFFGVLGAALAFGFARGFSKGGTGAFLPTWIVGSLLAVLDEIHQLFVPGRDANPWDAGADIIGVALGAALFLFMVDSGKRRESRARLQRPGKPFL